MASEYDYIIPIIMVGDPGVGKASLQARFTGVSNSTDGVNFTYRTMTVAGKTVQLQLWNSSIQQRFRTLTSSYYRGKEGVFAIYDVTNEGSFKDIAFWMQEVERYGTPKACMLIGNKGDLVEQRVVATDKAKEHAKSLEMLFFETSATDGTNVELALTTMITEIIKRRSYILLEEELNTFPSAVKPVYKKSSFAERIRDTLEKLRIHQGASAEEDQNNYNDITDEMETVKAEEAQSVAAKQEELEKLLVAAPASVALLAHLCIVSSTSKDFRLQIPLKGFKHVKYEWFRGGLMQVVSRGAQSFALANKNIATIEAISKHIPGLILDVLQLLLHGSRADLKTLLPDKLASVVEKADRCTKLSSEAEEIFESLVTLLNELAETFTATLSEQESQRTKKKELSTDSIVEKDANQNISEPSFREITDALLEGLKNLIQVRQKWNRLTRFFTGLAQVIRIEMQEPFETFKEAVAKKADKQVRQDKELSEYAKETLRGKAREIAQKGFQVNMICVMFLQVSQTYLQAPLLKLDELLTLTSSDAPLAEQLQRDIAAACVQAQREIEEKVKQTNEETFVKFRAEMDAIEQAANFEKKGWSLLAIFTRK